MGEKTKRHTIEPSIMYATTGCLYFGANTVTCIALCYVIKSALIMMAVKHEPLSAGRLISLFSTQLHPVECCELLAFLLTGSTI